ncbi:MAG: hypothetical protein KBC84_04995 [Proteobacteria bacterium]|nr:hypothetical protein [Pseudomonadota bacterium]
MELVCYKCNTKLSLPSGTVSRTESCLKCSADVKVCLNCDHYDPKSYNECKEPNADRVVDKEKSNFCDYFKPRQKALSKDSHKEDKFKDLESLFKK